MLLLYPSFGIALNRQSESPFEKRMNLVVFGNPREKATLSAERMAMLEVTVEMQRQGPSINREPQMSFITMTMRCMTNLIYSNLPFSNQVTAREIISTLFEFKLMCITI